MGNTRAFQDMHLGTPALPPFLGRAQDMAEIGVLLADPSCRLLTLTGPGGIGKTRLAMEVAAHHRALFPDGVFWVPLTQLSRVDDLLPAIAEAMPFCFQQERRSPHEQFFAYLREKHAQQVLLVLDNVEHLLDGVDLLADILAATTGLHILATSREALNLQEEWIRPIVGLAYPDREEGKATGDKIPLSARGDYFFWVIPLLPCIVYAYGIIKKPRGSFR